MSTLQSETPTAGKSVVKPHSLVNYFLLFAVDMFDECGIIQSGIRVPQKCDHCGMMMGCDDLGMMMGWA